MYEAIGDVEVGETLRFDSSDIWWWETVTVERLTEKLIFDTSGNRFSREHGALFVNFGYDGYAGRVRKLTVTEKQKIAKQTPEED